MRLELGKPVRSKDDEVVGELADVIIDPVDKRVTHLVVKQHHEHGESRLVAIDLAVPDEDEDEISLSCAADEVRQLPNIEDFAYLRLGEPVVSDPDWDVGVTNVLALPYYDSALGPAGALDENVGVFYDRIPKGEVEIRRSSSVITADGEFVGEVDGFLVEGDHITHFVLERGHLWGRRDVTVPIGSVTRVESDTVTVGLSKDQIGALPSRSVHRWRLFGKT